MELSAAVQVGGGMGVTWSKKVPEIPQIAPEERTAVVEQLVQLCADLRGLVLLLVEENQMLRDEIARLKGLKPRPPIQPSRLEARRSNEPGAQQRQTRPGSSKRSKTEELAIHQEKVIAPQDLPPGSVFKGYQDYTVQDLLIEPFNTRFRLERWETPQGENVVGQLPAQVQGGHFGPTLVSYILYQYYHARVTQPLLLEELLELGVEISAGQLHKVLIEGKERYHAEKEEILRVGLAVSRYVNVDDTLARHEGQNGFCTHIGNELFAYFESTESKSRINFLQLLRGKYTDYLLSEEALAYMWEHDLGPLHLSRLLPLAGRCFADEAEWRGLLQSVGISTPRQEQIATEGALLGSVLEHGISPQLCIISDDAGQFNVLQHGLCWIHAERTLAKLIAPTAEQREAIEEARTELWELYQALKLYKSEPTAAQATSLEERFETLFTRSTCSEALNEALARLHRNKRELLLVLRRPEVPLHNNLSENDIREYAVKRKISGSTRSDEGRRCRDTFASLKKTCRKLAVSFWAYLRDRLSLHNCIPPLPQLIEQRARASPTSRAPWPHTSIPRPVGLLPRKSVSTH